jgi:molybdopterin converting factor subunit 1
VKLRVRLFAVARQLAGTDQVTLEVPEPCTAGQLRLALSDQVPALRDVLPRILLAVDSDYVQPDAVIPANAEVACIPPVSGG